MYTLNENPIPIWERLPIIRLLFPYCIGIIAFDNGLAITSWVLNALVISSWFLFLLLHMYNKKYSFLRYCQYPACFISYILLAILICNLLYPKSKLSSNKNIQYLGIVDESPRIKNNYITLKTSTIAYWEKQQWLRLNEHTHLVVPVSKSATPAYTKGDTVLFNAQFNTIENKKNPYVLDYKTIYKRMGLYKQAFVDSTQIKVVNTSMEYSFIDRIHAYALTALATHLKDSASLGLMNALLLGDRVAMQEDINQAYIDTGIIHIVAISGSHVALLFTLLSYLLGFIKHKKHTWIKYCIALPFIWLYVILAGAPPSAIRAAMMFTLINLAWILNREQNSVHQLLIGAFLMLLIEPNWLFNIGFQLSFLAVLSIICFYAPIKKSISIKYRLLQWIWDAIAMSLAAEILVAPLVLYYFHNFPMLFIISNLLAAICMSIVLFAGILLTVCSNITVLGTWISYLVSFLVHHFNTILIKIQYLQPLSWKHLPFQFWEMCLLYAIIITIVFYALKYKHSYLIATLFLVVLWLSIKIMEPLKTDKLIAWQSNKDFLVTQLKGDSCYILSPITEKQMNSFKWISSNALDHWQTWKIGNKPLRNVQFTWGSYQIVLLDSLSNKNDLNNEQVDYVFCYKIKDTNSLLQIQQKWHPKTIILVNGSSRYKTNQLTSYALKNTIPLFSTLDSGAFVLE
jgi:competence protein ComEC